MSSQDVFRFMRWAREAQTGSSAAKTVLLVLASHADWNLPLGNRWMSQQDLAREAELSDRTVRTALKHLEEAGFIRRKRRGRQGERLPDEFEMLAAGQLQQPENPSGSNDSLPETPSGGSGSSFRSTPERASDGKNPSKNHKRPQRGMRRGAQGAFNKAIDQEPFRRLCALRDGAAVGLSDGATRSLYLSLVANAGGRRDIVELAIRRATVAGDRDPLSAIERYVDAEVSSERVRREMEALL